MLRNYLKTAIRSIARNPLTAFINILGLALAMACALLIFLYIQDETAYEKHHRLADRIYRVTRSFHSAEGEVNLHLANVAPPIGPLLKNDFGEIEVMARTLNFNTVVSLEENGSITQLNNEPNLFLAEPDLFNIFDIEVIAGNKEKGLERPFSVMLSLETAKRYFGGEDVMGKHLRINNTFDLEVTGVYRDFPPQSHWHPDFLVSFSTLENDDIYGRTNLETNWGNNAFGTYLVLKEGADPAKLEANFPAFIDRHFGGYIRSRYNDVPTDWEASKTTTLYLQKLTDIHLHSHLDDELEANGNINTVITMGIIGFFIILIACFNFINLSTAHATKRAREVGMRKVVGAIKRQLIIQYLGESTLIACFGLVFALVLAFFALDWLNAFTNKQMSLAQWPLLVISAAFVLTVGILAGIYPAFVVSGFKPALILKGKTNATPGKGGVRKVLVVSQFAISIVLIIATLVTYRQLHYLNNKSLGYQKEYIVTIPYYSEIGTHYDAFYTELTRSSLIQDMGRSSRIPTGRLLDSYGGARVIQGDSLMNSSLNLKTVSVDESFFDTYGIPMAAGRNFSKAIPTDDSLAFIINETAARELGWKVLEDHIDEDFHYAGVSGKLIGIVKDFHFESLHQPISPMIFLQQRNRYSAISIKIARNEIQPALQQLERTWKEFAPAQPFQYTFLNERYANLYEAELKQNRLFTTFAGLAVFIASLGLFGLTVFNTLQRMKEIGIRKVLGASVPNIVKLLSKEIIILIVAANLIAWPVAWYFMEQWLETFAYRIEMPVLVYMLAALSAFAVALVTVSLQTIRAARSNPAQTLRYE